MLNRLVEASLRYKFLVLIVFGWSAFLGLRAVRDVPIDAFPDVTPAQVNIYTESPGLAAEDVEQLLTFPVESAMAGLPKVQEIRSVSLFGLSYVSVYFEDDMDIYFARQLVNERLQEVGDRLPEGYGKPSMGPNSSGLGQVFWYTVERNARRHVRADHRHGPAHLAGLDGAADPAHRTGRGRRHLLGRRRARVPGAIDPQRLYARGLGFADVIAALPANNGQVGGNVMDVGQEQYLVRGLGLLTSTEDIGGIVLKAEDGVPVYMRDVARVIESPAPRFGAVTRDGEEVVLGMALSRLGENAKDVVEAVKSKLETVRNATARRHDGQAGLRAHRSGQQGRRHRHARPDRRLDAGRADPVPVPRRTALGAGGDRDLAAGDADRLHRHGAVRAVGQPDVARGSGDRHRHDGRRRRRDGGERVPDHGRAPAHGERVDKTSAVLAAAKEVANPITFAILIIIVVFLPLFSLEGLEGKLFKPMAFNIAFAMAGSLVLSLTLIPVLAAMILKPKQERTPGWSPVSSASIRRCSSVRWRARGWW
jgi:cobalt-zinc-cadmium resistance protein CzcA